MASRNADAVANQGEFHASRPRDEPLTKTGHQVGTINSEKDAAPEFHAEVLPAGSAPFSKTYQPNPDTDPSANTASTNSAVPSASSTLGGATSADVHTGLGHPGEGQSSKELRHDGQNSGKKQGLGQAGQASNVGNDLGSVDGRVDTSQRGLYSEEGGRNAGTRGTGGTSAEEREPEGAGRVASEN